MAQTKGNRTDEMKRKTEGTSDARFSNSAKKNAVGGPSGGIPLMNTPAPTK